MSVEVRTARMAGPVIFTIINPAGEAGQVSRTAERPRDCACGAPVEDVSALAGAAGWAIIHAASCPTSERAHAEAATSKPLGGSRWP